MSVTTQQHGHGPDDADQVSRFYDEYVDHQQTVAHNLRHKMLVESILGLGVNSTSRILELGCGIGVLTQLIAPKVKRGLIKAVDISPRSIELAKANTRRFPQVRCEVADLTKQVDLGETFDVVTACDVLEHIPAAEHTQLFAGICRHMNEKSSFFVNIPSPEYNDYLREHHSESMQIIDQSLQANELLHDAYQAGLVLRWFRSYDIWHRNDYQMMVFQRRVPFKLLPVAGPGRLERLIQKTRCIMRRLAGCGT